MIRSFAHKGLERFFVSGNQAGIQAIHAKRLRLILSMLHDAQVIDDMIAPALRLHPLKGNLRGYWAVTVQANWRVNLHLRGWRRPRGRLSGLPLKEVSMRMHNPPHPGEILSEMWLVPLGLTITAAAEGLGVSRKTLSAIVNGRAAISPEMAIRLEEAFGKSAESWLSHQIAYDLWQLESVRGHIGVTDLTHRRAA